MFKECPHCKGTGKFEIIPLSLEICKKCKFYKVKSDTYPMAGGDNIVTYYDACMMRDKIFGSRIEEGERMDSDCIHKDKHIKQEQELGI